MKDEDVQYEFVRELLLDNPRLYLSEIRHQCSLISIIHLLFIQFTQSQNDWVIRERN